MQELISKFNHQDIYIDHKISETIRDLMERQDTDKYTYKYTGDNRKTGNKQQRKQNITYYIKFHNINNYEVTQKFKEDSKLLKYLQHKAPGIFQEHIKYHALHDILLSIVNICKKESLYDSENPMVVVCDHYMRDTLDIEAFHLTDLTEIILQQMETKALQDRNYIYAHYEIPIYVKNREEYVNSLTDPPWTKLNAKMIRAKQKYRKINKHRKYKMDKDLFEILKQGKFLNQNEQIANYDTLAFAFVRYTHTYFHIFKKKKTHKNMYNIRNTPLKILGIDRLHKYQLETILATKLTTYNHPLRE